jgi:hypothetical protein
MSNIKLVFLSSEKSEVNSEMECFYNDKNEIFITIYDSEDIYNQQFICLDKDTAVKFVKHLKREISYIESEVKNG